jgi:TP901 family phage tail tape measure protein
MSGSTVIETKIKAVNESQQAFKQLDRDLKKVQTEGNKATTVWDRFGRTGKKAAKGTGEAMNGLAGRASFLTGALGELGPVGLGAAAAFASIGVAVTKSVQVFGDFEQKMLVVKGVSRANQEEFVALSAAARAMGRETEWSASQAAEAQQYLAKAGLDVSQTIQALPGMLDLATAGQLDLAEASDIVTDSMSGMNMEVYELSRISDVFVATATRTNTDIRMLGESMKYAAPVASSLGYSVEETAAYLGVLANAGIKASDAGTDLRAIMLKTSEAAVKLGLDVDAKLVDVLHAASEAGWDANRMTEEFGRLAVKSALVIQRETDAYQDLYETLGDVNGESKRLAGEMRSGQNAAIQTLMSSLESLGITFGKVLSPAVVASVNGITAAVRELDEAIQILSGDTQEVSLDQLRRNLAMAQEEYALVLADGHDEDSVIVEGYKKKVEELQKRVNEGLAKQGVESAQGMGPDSWVVRDKDQAALDKKAREQAAREREEQDALAKKKQEDDAKAAKKAAAEEKRLNDAADKKVESDEKARLKRLAQYREKLDEARYGKEYVQRQRIEAEAVQMVKDGASEVDVELWKSEQFDELNKKMLDGIDGWKIAFGDFGDEAQSTFDGVSDSIISTLSTGNAALDQFLQKMLEIAVMNPLQNMLLGSATSGADPFGGMWGTIGGGAMDLFTSFFHDGGVVGGPAPARLVPADLFRGAPRLHSGGGIGPGERPIIAKDGEIVLNQAQQKNVASGLGTGGDVQVHIHNSTGEQASQQKSTDNMGNTRIDVMIGDAAAQQMNTPGSSLNRAVRASTGMQRQVIRR